MDGASEFSTTVAGRETPAAARAVESQPRTSHRDRPLLLLFASVIVVAAVVYSIRLGSAVIAGSEAYSAFAAGKPSIAAIVAIPINHDPGKVIGYYVALHFWADVFGTGPIALHSFSVVFTLGGVALLFLLGREMFDDQTAAAAATVWAFAPYAVAFSQIVRMYPLVIALALAHLLMLWRTRTHPSASRAALAGILGAALLYTHLGGLLVIGAEGALLARDFVRGRTNAMPWLALAIALLLFAPVLPITASEARVLTQGQALDWIGAVSQYSIAIKLAAAAVALAAAAWLMLGRNIEPHGEEPVRWLLTLAALPPIALATASIVVRPMFNPRYVAPSAVASVLLASAALALIFGAKWRNLAAAAVATGCLVLLPFSYPGSQPWPEIARTIAASPSTEPVFFEAGYVSHGPLANRPNDGFPFGYYLIPFNYNFKGDNPRLVVPGYDPEGARQIIESHVAAAGGGWLISWKTDAEAAQELPDIAHVHSAVRIRTTDLTVYRLDSAAVPAVGASPR
jgi:uncharacterized membrane protein